MKLLRLVALVACLAAASPAPALGQCGVAKPLQGGGSCAGTDYSSDVLCAASLAGYWRMTDSTGSTLADSSTSRHNVTKTAGVTLGSASLVAGSPATSALFDGSTGYATLDAAGATAFHDWNYNQAWTVEAVIRPNFTRSGSTQYAIFSKLQSSGNFTGFEVTAEYNAAWRKSRLRVYIINALGTRHIEVIGDSDLTNGVNHHIVASYNGNGLASGVSMYVDGVLQAKSVIADNLASASIVNSVTPTIGARNAGAAAPFNGNIQELAVYSGTAQTTSSLVRSDVYSAGKPYYHWGLAQGRSPLAAIARPNLILDTDLASDIDDVGDLALAMGFHLRGEANLVGVITSSANDRSADAAYAIARYMSDSTAQSFVGAWQGAAPPGPPSNSVYSSDISATFGANQGRASYADSTAKYRALLNAQPNGSVVIVATGFFAALNALLSSPASYHGDGLGTGASIIAAKVARLVIVAGCYPSDADCPAGNYPEFNFANGPAADASKLTAGWPTEMVAVGIELAGTPAPNVLAGPATANSSATNPVQQAFHDWGSTPRAAWGMLGVLFAVRGVNSGIEVAGLRGSLTVNPSTGANRWSNALGNVSWTRLSATPSAFNTLFDSVYLSLPNPF